MKIKSYSIIVFVLSLAYGTTLYGQTIDQERMDRDLKIAENILNTLSNKDKSFYVLARSIESNYIPDYGVILSIPQNIVIYSTGSAAGIAVVTPGSSASSSGYSYSYTTPSAESDEDDSKRKTEEELERENEKRLTEIMTIFLVDYADLIGQLKATDRIRINVRSRNNQVWIASNDIKMNASQGKSAEILKGDLIDYKQGKLTRDETIKKIVFTDGSNEIRERDLELFSSIFSRLYESDLSDTYYTSSRQIGYERLQNLGVIYNMRVYSSTQDDGFHRIQTTGEGGLTQEERNEKVNAMYPEFERSLKENILDYGRTIKSLAQSEMLIMKVQLTECIGCEMPKKIQLSVKAKVLADFDSNKISRENALKEISVKKLLD